MANSGGRQIVGILSLFVGSYLIYSAVANIGPLKTLIDIVQNPGSARDTVKGKKYPISGQPLLTAAGTNTGANSGTLPGSGSGGAAIVAFARAQIGKPYSSPGDSNTTWDCSGLTKAAVMHGTGIDIPHLVSLQIASTKGSFVSKDKLQPGDIVFPMPGHCGVFTSYAADGKTPIMVDAPDWGRTVVERPMWAFMSAKRFAGVPVSNPGGGGGNRAV